MKQAWFIAKSDFLYQLKDRNALIWLFLMPIVFFYFIGTVTGTGGGGAFKPLISPLTVIEAEDSGFLAAQVKLRFSENGFDLKAFDSKISPSRRLKFPPNFTEAVLEGEPVKLQLIENEAGLNTQLDEFRALRSAYTVLADLAVLSQQNLAATAENIEALNTTPRPLTLEVKPAGQRRTIPTGFEQAIPGTMVMFTLLVLLTTGASTLFLERQNGQLSRLASAPLTRSQLVFGKWLGRMGLGILQVAFAMTVGTLLFKMNWGPDLPMVMLILIAWAAFCTSCSILLAHLGRNVGEVSAIGVLLSNILAALGGAWWPIEITPDFMQTLQKFLPSGWAMDAMHQLVSFEAGALNVLPQLAALLLGALVVAWLGVRRFEYQ